MLLRDPVVHLVCVALDFVLLAGIVLRFRWVLRGGPLRTPPKVAQVPRHVEDVPHVVAVSVEPEGA
jgi:hypothetical protein